MSINRIMALAATGCLAVTTAECVSAYTPVDPQGSLRPGAGVYQQTGINGIVRPSHPADFWGKEYSHDRDRSTPGQVTLWDGSGRTANGLDYGANPFVAGFVEANIDALGNSRDALFGDLITDRTAMAFSYDDQTYAWGQGGWGPQTLPSGGPFNVFAGGVAGIGGAGEITRSTPGTVNLSRWATRGMIDGTAPPRDVDGLELWGERPDPQGGILGDASKYSLQDDHLSGVSVWNADGTGYLSHSEVVKTVTNLLGPVPAGANGFATGTDGSHLIDLDAMVLRDGAGSQDHFAVCREVICDIPPPSRGVDQEGAPIGGPQPFPGFGVFVPDTVVFSIRQIPLANGTGYYATGGELFVLSYTGEWFLQHGGATWDHTFAENELRAYEYQDPHGNFIDAPLDINALEAIADVVVPPVGPPTGDFNADGVVDAADYTVWRDNSGGVGCGLAGDANGDCVVDGMDREAWASNYNASGVFGPSMSVAVPEPTAAILASGLLLASAASSRRD